MAQSWYTIFDIHILSKVRKMMEHECHQKTMVKNQAKWTEKWQRFERWRRRKKEINITTLSQGHDSYEVKCLVMWIKFFFAFNVSVWRRVQTMSRSTHFLTRYSSSSLGFGFHFWQNVLFDWRDFVNNLTLRPAPRNKKCIKMYLHWELSVDDRGRVGSRLLMHCRSMTKFSRTTVL